MAPGDSFNFNVAITNDATEEMYVFLVVEQPVCNGQSLYTYSVNSNYSAVYNTPEKQVYAYAGDEMIPIQPGERTDALTTQMTMKNISNAEYANIVDLNVTVTGYAIGTEDISTVPNEAWNLCKVIGDIDE